MCQASGFWAPPPRSFDHALHMSRFSIPPALPPTVRPFLPNESFYLCVIVVGGLFRPEESFFFIF